MSTGTVPGQHAPAGKWRSLAANLLLSVVTTVLVLTTAEAVARFFERPRRPLRSKRLAEGWQAEWHGDFYTIKSAAAGWPPWLEFNRDGLRDQMHPLEKLEGVHRIVCLGDSVTLGPDGHPEQAYPQLLQARLDALAPGFEVFNVSLWGWATRQERIAYERIARKYSPDHVILGICLNDVQDMQNNLGRPPPFLSALHRQSALVRRLVNAEGYEIASVEELFAAPESPRVRAGFQRVFEEIQALDRDVTADGGQLSVVVFPFRGQAKAAPPAPSPQSRFRAFCQAEGIAFLDLLPALRGLGESAFIDDDGIHLSRPGLARVADEIVRARLIPQAGPALAVGSRPAELVAPLGSGGTADRVQAAWALGQSAPAAQDVVAPLVRTLEDEAAPVRAAAANALGHLGRRGRAAAPNLLRALEDPSQTVRWRAAEALARIDAEPSTMLSPLVSRLRSPDVYVRAFAAWSLGEMGENARPAAPALANALQDRDPGFRVVVERALGKVRSPHPAVLAALCSLLRSGTEDDRWRAARALGRIGPAAASAIAPLVEASGDDSQTVRQEVTRALERIGSRTATSASYEESSPKVHAASGQASTSPRQVP